MEGEADRARAVIARGFEGAVAATPDVGRGGDRVRRFDRGRDRCGGGTGHAGLAFGDVVGALARGQRCRRAGWHRRAAGGELFGDRGEVVAQRCFARFERFQPRLPLGLGGLELGEAGLGLLARLGRFPLLDGDLVAGVLDLEANRGHPLHRRAGLVAQRLDPGGNGVVVFLDLVEVAGASVDFRPARRVEDDVEHVGAAALVDRDEAVAQHVEGALQSGPDPLQAALVSLQLLRRRVQLGLLLGEFGLGRGLALAQCRDFADHRVDRPVLLGDRRGDRALALAHIAELALGVVQLLFERLGGSRGRHAEEGEEQRRGQQQAP